MEQEQQPKFKRWYDYDPVLLQVINMLKDYQSELRNQAEVFLLKIEERVSKETIDKYANKEVCSFVVGSSCFSKNNLRQTVTELADYQKLLRKVKK